MTRAVVTGIGVVAPSGIGADAHWKTVLDGTTRLGRITRFDPSSYPVTLAGEVPEFDVDDYIAARLKVATDRWTWHGFAATQEALDDSGIDLSTMDPYDTAVALASSSGGNEFGQGELQALWSEPGGQVSVYQSIAWFYAASVGQISILHQMKGQCSVLVAESAGGLDSFAQATRTIRRGTKVVLAGGTEGPLSPYALTCQLSTGRLATGTDPETAYRPFEGGAAGYVAAEGGAVLLVEDLDHARERGAEIHGEVLGWAATHDGRASRPGDGGDGEQVARAMRMALERAGREPSDVDVVFPDAVGVPEADRVEARAIRDVFGDEVPVTTQKGRIGRMYQGGAAVDVATALQSMRYDTLPATPGLTEPAPGCELNFVTEPTTQRTSTALVNARGYDGYNTALVVGRYEEAA
ncbi:MAG: ketosynthase chain-length factor [Actinophytocola sp.]|uniref:beta-ketoacyl synthase N-terminal-like domain-containing protein n=1 Tax=Actinophytocola sp. TaxID=1872138 RepID=UPI00132B78BB|nr:beta-ketoacyl synthase N-terminal-like domain-containing protein [Actinophytocola sp.]MPZ81105.1 ketosynthase chain-length factor [Actinophytocola sp.]